MFTSEDLADAMAVVFNEIPKEELEFAFEAVVPDDVAEVFTESGGWVVYVIPFSEGEESIDRGDTCREDLQVDVYVHGPLSPQITKRVGVRFMRRLRRALRQTRFSGVDADDDDTPYEFIWDKVETVNGIYDADYLKTKNRFLAMFRASYYDFA